MDRHRNQIETVPTSIERIMSSKSFALGVKDRRRGAPPQFDRELPDEGDEDAWDYERGRLWASIAPVSMPLRIGKQLNPKAVALCRSAFDRGYIR
jgi:hypothetical protein